MEQPPKQKTKESTELLPISRLHSEAAKLENHVEKLESSGSTDDISEETVERVRTKVGKIRSILKAASIGIALLGAYEVGSYATSRYEITVSAGPDGKLNYKHDDPETTRIMEYLIGAGELPAEDRMYFYQQVVRDAHTDLLTMNNADQGIGAQNSFEEGLPSDEESLRELLRDIYTESDLIAHGSVQGDLERRIDTAFAESIKQSVPYDPVLEKIVWDIHKKVGAPRIRWSAPEDSTYSQIIGHFIGPGRANYSERDNTVYIRPGSGDDALGNILISEDAHALQFNKHPVRSRVRFVIDMTNLAIRAVQENESLYDAHQDDYHIPGTIEYEAHREIEPRLIEEAQEEERRLARE